MTGCCFCSIKWTSRWILHSPIRWWSWSIGTPSIHLDGFSQQFIRVGGATGNELGQRRRTTAICEGWRLPGHCYIKREAVIWHKPSWAREASCQTLIHLTIPDQCKTKYKMFKRCWVGWQYFHFNCNIQFKKCKQFLMLTFVRLTSPVLPESEQRCSWLHEDSLPSASCHDTYMSCTCCAEEAKERHQVLLKTT